MSEKRVGGERSFVVVVVVVAAGETSAGSVDEGVGGEEGMEGGGKRRHIGKGRSCGGKPRDRDASVAVSRLNIAFLSQFPFLVRLGRLGRDPRGSLGHVLARHQHQQG